MKMNLQHPKLFLLAALIITGLSSFTQKQFTHTATRANNSCNGDCTLLDIADLNNNPDAIIFVTPHLEKGVNLNPHPIGVYYFKNQWNIFNLDQVAIPAGSKFDVEYILRPDAKYFQYTITAENVRKDGSALIDHPSLNKNPSVKFTSFLSWNPDIQRGTTNRELVNIQYNADAGKWVITNINQKPVFARVVYNIAITSAGNNINIPSTNNSVVIPAQTVTPATSSQVKGVSMMYLTVWANGSKLAGDNERTNYLDKTSILGFEFVAKSVANGRRQYESVTIKSRIGYPATLPLFDAFVKNSVMIFTIEAYSVSDAGVEELNFTIKLTGARLVGFKQLYEEDALHPTSLSPRSKIFYDEIKITFTQIECTNSVGYTVIDNL